MKSITVCFLVFFFVAVEDTQAENVVNLTVYYESLCMDSINFVRFQLYPTWLLLSKNYMRVDFVPYGKASQTRAENGTWEFICQHGPQECKGNKIQACAVDLLKDNVSKQMDYIACIMSSRDPAEEGENCAEHIGIDYTPIKTCAESADGDNALAALGERTHNFTPTITFVPTIAYNNVYDQTDQDGSLTSLITVICNKLAPKPDACSG